MKLSEEMKNFWKKLFSKEKMNASFKTKHFKSGGYSLLISVIAIALVVAANLLLNAIPSKYMSFDITNTGIYTLQDQTKLVLDQLDKDIKVYVLAETGSEDVHVTQLLNKYSSYNNKISIEVVDPVRNPTFVKSYTDEEVASGSLILVSGDKSTIVNYSDIYTENTSYTSSGYTSSTSFDGQQKITSAIDRLSSDDLPKLYVLAGHGELAVSDTLTANITDENIEIADLQLLSAGSVPEDADCVLIYSPTQDLSDDEAEMMTTYLNSGGRLLLITDCPLDSHENLLAIMNNYGLKYVDGIVVEGNASYCMANYPHYLAPELVSNDITDPLINSGLRVLMPMSHAITKTDDARSTLRINALLATSEDAYIKIAGYDMQTLEKEEGDIEGTANIAYSVSETIDDTTTKLVWIGSGSIANDSVDSYVSGTNTSFLLNTLGWLTDKESSISLHSISLDSETIAVTSSWSSALSTLFIGVLPVGMLVYGIAVSVKRRKKV